MKHQVIFILSYCMAWHVAATDITFSWNGSADESGNVIRLDAPASTGLNGGIYVAPSVKGLRIEASSPSSSGIKWHKFTSMGAAYAQGIEATANHGNQSCLDNPEGNAGYIVDDGKQQVYLWIVDHSSYPLIFSSLSESDSHDCQYLDLDFSGSADEIVYFGINGHRNTLPRDISVTYTTLEWDDSRDQYIQTGVDTMLDHISKNIHVSAPLCATTFTLAGDRFAKTWGREITYTSPIFPARSITAHTEVISTDSPADNEISTSSPGALGGSAPYTATFRAEISDAAVFHEWQFSRTPDFQEVYLREPETTFTHTFDERGTTYVRLYCTNDDASCEYFSETYEVGIGESSLKCPNAFTPFNQDGVNDEWKVSYSSIIEYECHIFNRHGKKIVSLSDPSQGWDGRSGGKFVAPGTYYYVIKARGADGKNYKLSGDINIIEHR